MKRLIKFMIDKSLFSSVLSPLILLKFEPYVSNWCRKFNISNYINIVNTFILALISMVIQLILEWLLSEYEKRRINVRLTVSKEKNDFDIDSSVRLDLNKCMYIYLELRLDGYKKYIRGSEIINIFFPKDVDIDFPSDKRDGFFEIDGNNLKINLGEIFQKGQKEIRNYSHVIKLAILPVEKIINSVGVTVGICSNTSKRCRGKIMLQGNYEKFILIKRED